jgi:probable F420-dependent oxidoreductase
MMVSKAIGSPVELAEQAFYAKLRHLGARIKTKNLNHKGSQRNGGAAARCGKGDDMRFGFTIKPDMPVERIVALTRQAEAAGFQYGWIFDSHVLWLEPYPLLTLMASNTKNMRLGTCVTNPATRDITVTASLFATLNLISGGRMQLGIGRGDSSRRVLGKKPVGAGDLERAVKAFRELTAGREIDYEGQPTRLSWAKGSPPVWIAGYGPKVLDLAGRVADGVILQFADPDLIAWCLGFVKKGAEEAGRDWRKIEVMAAAPVWVSDDLKVARERVRWFPALVSNHVVDLISRYKPEELPPALTSFVRNRGGYDYQHHCEVESSNANFVSDDVVDRFCLVGTAEAHREKLRKLAGVGVTQFNVYLMCGEEEDTLETYKKEILPASDAMA